MKVRIKNKLYLHFPPKRVEKWLKKELTVLNPTWLENERMGRWNNNTPKHLEFYGERKGVLSIPIGIGYELHQNCEKYDIDIKYFDQRTEVPIDIEFKGKLKDFQVDALSHLRIIGTLEAPTGAGKTVMGIGHICQLKQKTLILVHTKELAYQWIDRLKQFTDCNELDDIGLIGDGSYVIGKKATIGMVQTCYKHVATLATEFGMVIGDECHRAPSRMYTDILSKLNCKYRLGLTATPYRRDKLNKLITWYCGPIRHKVSKKILVDEGHILQPQFVMKYTNFTTTVDPVAEYTKMISELANNDIRNKQIANDVAHLCKNSDKNCLVISDRKYHCELLSHWIYNYSGIEHFVLTGDTPQDERKIITKSIGKTHNLLIATGQLIGEGFDCKNLDALFITTPIKFAGRITQYIGRIMRSAKDKERPLVVDYIDWMIPTLERSALARVKVYGKENTVFDTQGKLFGSNCKIRKVRTKKRHP